MARSIVSNRPRSAPFAERNAISKSLRADRCSSAMRTGGIGGDAAAPIVESRGNDEERGENGAETTEDGESKSEAAGTDAVDASQNVDGRTE